MPKPIYTSVEAEATFELPELEFTVKQEKVKMKFNRLVLRGNLTVQKVQPPGDGSFLAGPYNQFLPTQGVVGGADPANTDSNGYNTITAIIAGEATDTVTIPGDYIYEVDQPIQVPDGKTLQAADGTSATIKRKAGYTGNLFEFISCTGSTLKNFTIDGDAANFPALEGLATASNVNVQSGSNNIVQNCHVINACGMGVYGFESENLSVVYNEFEDCFASVYYNGGDLDNAGSITGNIFTNASLRSRQSIEATGTNNLQIFHNTIGGAGSVVPSVSEPEGTWGASIYIWNSAFFHVENNTCTQSYWSSFVLNGDATSGTVKHNYFLRGSQTTANGKVGAHIDGSGTNSIVFTLNIVDGDVQMGVAGGDSITVTYNVINSINNGIGVYGETVTAVIQGNQVNYLSGTGYGLYLFDKDTAAVSVQAMDNTISGFANSVGIDNTGSSGTVFGLTVTNNTFIGYTNVYSIPLGITIHVSCTLEGFVEPSEPPTESPNNSTIPPLTQLRDSEGAVWTVSGGVIYRDGTLGGFSANVVLLLYYNSVIYQQNQAGDWWSWTGGAGGTWLATSDPRTGSAPAVPSITVFRHPGDWLQCGVEASGCYFIEDNRWGQGSIVEGTDAGQFQEAVERSLQVGSLGEVAFRSTWNWPQFINGQPTDPSVGGSYNEVKAYPAIIYGRKPGHYGPDRWPAWEKAVRLPDGAVVAPPPGTPTPPANIWVSAGGSVSTLAPCGYTPGTNLPVVLPLSAGSVSMSGRFTASATGKGHLAFDIWLQNTPTQAFGFNANNEITHEIMIPLRNWGDYGRHPNGRNPSWLLYDTVVNGITYHVYRADFGWSFIVYQHDGVSHPLDANGKFNVDFAGIMADAASHGLVGAQYLVSVELGIEMVYGQGDITVYDYRVQA